MPTGAKEAPRCLIVDDHPVVRAGIRVVLEQAFAGSSVSEQAILDLEKEAFLSLCGEQKTRDRIQHMLTAGKPLRN